MQFYIFYIWKETHSDDFRYPIFISVQRIFIMLNKYERKQFFVFVYTFDFPLNFNAAFIFVRSAAKLVFR